MLVFPCSTTTSAWSGTHDTRPNFSLIITVNLIRFETSGYRVASQSLLPDAGFNYGESAIVWASVSCADHCIHITQCVTRARADDSWMPERQLD